MGQEADRLVFELESLAALEPETEQIINDINSMPESEHSGPKLHAVLPDCKNIQAGF